MNNNEREALRWYLQGSKDGRTARRNGASGDHEVACFLFQQAAEKVLKAYLFLHGERELAGHSTLGLSRSCAAYRSAFGELSRACALLDLYYMGSRYPFALPEGTPYEYFGEEETRRGDEAFQQVYALVYESFKDLVEHV